MIRNNCKLILVVILSLFISEVAIAECLSNNPSIIAKEFYLKHHDFYYAEPKKIQNLVTPKFYLEIEKEYKCSFGTGNLCALGADPWIAAQDGEIEDPIKFEILVNSDTKATVQMSYIFSLSPNHQKDQAITMNYERNDSSACWMLSDFITPEGKSLLYNLRNWHNTYGN